MNAMSGVMSFSRSPGFGMRLPLGLWPSSLNSQVAPETTRDPDRASMVGFNP